MIDIRDCPLVVPPDGALDRNEAIILSLLGFNDFVTTAEDRAPCWLERCAEGEVPDILAIRT